MGDDTHEEITAAVLLLAAEDAEAAEDAGAALEWICGEQGLAVLTQERIQDFCWYELPVKWMSGQEDPERVTAALARALDLLGLSRYAGICRSQTTREVLAAYQAGTRDGLAAFRRASAASGISPPDLPDFTWGEVMGWQEAAARSSAADYLELAVTSGDLIPGKRGWKARQRELTRTHLDAPRHELLGQSLATVILSERAETWVAARRSPTRQRIAADVANRLLHPVRLPADAAADPLPRWRWMLGQFSHGVPLTQKGNLGRAFVQDNAERFDWDLSRPPSTEDELYDLHQLRHFAHALGLTRRAGRTLTLSPKGQRLVADPGQLWHATAAALLRGNAFTEFIGEMFLAMLVSTDSLHADEINETLEVAVGEEGFRDSRTELPPGERDISWAAQRTINLCRALGMLAADGSWPQRRYAFTPVGTSTALEALRTRATGPRNFATSDH